MNFQSKGRGRWSAFGICWCSNMYIHHHIFHHRLKSFSDTAERQTVLYRQIFHEMFLPDIYRDICEAHGLAVHHRNCEKRSK
eukprot:EC719093.1.p2 GENE.EC719093.1~~EC719093.1.p2  ORF type:complete len:82 (-),score=0.11 EC719093.1:30-275(-)